MLAPRWPTQVPPPIAIMATTRPEAIINKQEEVRGTRQGPIMHMQILTTKQSQRQADAKHQSAGVVAHALKGEQVFAASLRQTQ
jgi:hypothetical protein